MHFLRVAVCVVGVCLWSGCNKSEKPTTAEKPIEKVLTEKEKKKIRKEINADYKTTLISELINKKVRAGFNGSVLVAQKVIVLYENAFGFSKDTIPNTKDSKFISYHTCRRLLFLLVQQYVDFHTQQL